MPVPCDLRSILERLLVEFGANAYWYGEDTGDYDLEHLPVPAPAFFTSAVDRLMGIVAGNGHDCACFAEGARVGVPAAGEPGFTTEVTERGDHVEN